mmetsp:Transcript_23623/g.49986  ORF Transcript_23623/g.49986 Transcript_23623/m.49986 type:complete len:243 (+) Transcript_23623:829-1557(+)
MAASYASEGCSPLDVPASIMDESTFAICDIFRHTFRQLSFQSMRVSFPFPSPSRGSPPVHPAERHGCPQSLASRIASERRPDWTRRKHARRRRASSTSSSGERKEETSTGLLLLPLLPSLTNADRRGASGKNALDDAVRCCPRNFRRVSGHMVLRRGGGNRGSSLPSQSLRREASKARRWQDSIHRRAAVSRARGSEQASSSAFSPPPRQASSTSAGARSINAAGSADSVNSGGCSSSSLTQ